MALLTAYLARTAQRNAVQAAVSPAGDVFARIATFVRAAAEALSQAQEMRRVMARKYPFMPEE